jgi:CDP-glucose 4,6-dehydratase
VLLQRSTSPQRRRHLAGGARRQQLAAIWAAGASWITDSAPTVHEAQFLRLDATKAHAVLSWQPRLQIEAAVEWSLNWYRAWHLGSDMAQETRAQIAAYDRLPVPATHP